MSNFQSTSSSQSLNPLSKAHIRKIDRFGRIHVRQMDSTPNRVTRFRKIQKLFLNGKLHAKSPLGNLGIGLVCFDGISTQPDLEAALKYHRDSYAIDDKICIDWQNDRDLTNRRFLSHFSIKFLTEAKNGTVHGDDTITHINEALSEHFLCIANPLYEFLEDAKAWLTEVLPGPLWAHCTSSVLLSALPRSVLARKTSKLSISITKLPLIADTVIALAGAFDGYFDGVSGRGGAGVIQKIKAICINRNAPHYKERRRMLRDCMSLKEEARDAGMIASLLLAWAIDFIESGTPWYFNYAPNSIEKYIGSVIQQLLQRFQEIKIDELTAEKFEDIYNVIVASVKPSQQQTASAAIKAWHAFLVHWLDVPTITRSFHDNVEPAIPRANIVWPHETALILAWIRSSSLDERLKEQISVALQIALHFRIRISELLKLRMHNFRIFPNGIQVQINPMRRDGKPKSVSGRRQKLIEDQVVVDEISKWLGRRKKDGAYSTDLLFADPHNPAKGYKLGQLYVFLNRLMKAATGDRNVAFHTLSHGWVSENFEALLMQKTRADLNPLDLASTEAAHADTQTSFLHYFHKFELPLRYHLDRALYLEIGITGSVIEKFTSMSADAFRKKCSRKKGVQEKQEIAWQTLTSSTDISAWPTAHSTFLVGSPLPPEFLSAKQPLRFSDVLNILCDLARGINPPNIGSRNGKREGMVFRLAELGCDVLKELKLIGKTIETLGHTDAFAALQGYFSSGKNVIDFGKIGQAKLTSVRSYLDKFGNDPILSGMANSWMCCFENGYLSLSNPASAGNLIKLLHEAGISSDSLILCTSEYGIDEKLIRSINSIFSGAGYPAPYLMKINERRGRPQHYLTLSSQPVLIGKQIGSAALSIGGFNALMFATSVYAQIVARKSKQSHRKINGPHRQQD